MKNRLFGNGEQDSSADERGVLAQSRRIEGKSRASYACVDLPLHLLQQRGPIEGDGTADGNGLDSRQHGEVEQAEGQFVAELLPERFIADLFQWAFIAQFELPTAGIRFQAARLPAQAPAAIAVEQLVADLDGNGQRR